MRLDCVDGIQHPSERIVDLVRYPRCEAPEHCVLLLLGEVSREGLAFTESTCHRVEPVEQLTELAGDPVAVALGNALHSAVPDLLHVACEDTERLQHPLEHKVPTERKGERQASVHYSKRE